MDNPEKDWHFPAMEKLQKIPAWNLYGEQAPLPDILHIERIVDRAAGLDWHISPHRHVHLHQVFLLMSGAARLEMMGQSLTAAPPQVMNMPRGHVHGFAFSAGTEGYVLTLPATDFPELLGLQAEARAVLERPFIAPAPEGLLAMFTQLATLHAGHTALRRLRLRAAALTLFCSVAECGNAGADADDGDPRLQRFEDLVREHLRDGWQLAQYARALALSDRHLRRLCHETTGLSAHRFIEATRLREACRLLAYTRMRVQEVGFALGFDDPAYFARSFRRGMGMSPQEYRKHLEI